MLSDFFDSTYSKVSRFFLLSVCIVLSFLSVSAENVEEQSTYIEEYKKNVVKLSSYQEKEEYTTQFIQSIDIYNAKGAKTLLDILSFLEKDIDSANVLVDNLSHFLDYNGDVDLDKFPPKSRTRIENFLVTRKIYKGRISENEAHLLEIIQRDSSQLDDTTRLLGVYCAAYCSFFNNDFDRSANYFLQTIRLAKFLGREHLEVISYDALSSCYLYVNKLDSALLYGRMSIKKAEILPDKQRINIFLNYAQALSATGRIDSAYFYSDKSIKLAEKNFEKTGDRYSLINALYSFADLEKSANRFQSSIKNYLIVEDFHRQTKNFHALQSVLDSLGSLYEKTGDFKLSKEYRERSFELRDSISRVRFNNNIEAEFVNLEKNSLEKRIDEADTESQIASAIISKNIWNKRLTYSLALLLSIAFVFFLSKFRNSKKLEIALEKRVEEQTKLITDSNRKLERKAEELKLSNADLERFAYIASHDLKTPLRNISSFLGLAKRRIDKENNPEFYEKIELVQRNSQQMHDFVTYGLEAARVDASLEDLVKPFSIKLLVQQAWAQLDSFITTAKPSLQIKFDHLIEVPEDSMIIVFKNVFENAIVFNESPNPIIEITGEVKENSVVIHVSDNGVGIDPLYHRSIFSAFNSSSSFSNSDYNTGGVGLTICKKILTRIGGNITLTSSSPKDGTVFSIEIPKVIVQKKLVGEIEKSV